MSKFSTMIDLARNHVRNADPTEDEYIQDYLKGVSDALEVLSELNAGGDMMLEDTQRKVLRILYHLYKQNWVRPDVNRVSRMSVRTEERVREAIKGLRAAGYVEIAEGKMRILIPDVLEPDKPIEQPKPTYSMDIWMT